MPTRTAPGIREQKEKGERIVGRQGEEAAPEAEGSSDEGMEGGPSRSDAAAGQDRIDEKGISDEEADSGVLNKVPLREEG